MMPLLNPRKAAIGPSAISNMLMENFYASDHVFEKGQRSLLLIIAFNLLLALIAFPIYAAFTRHSIDPVCPDGKWRTQCRV